MATISDRLRELNLYAGLVFDEEDGAALMALLDNRERRVRGEIGTNYLKNPPTLAKGPTAGVYELSVGAFEGVSNQRPVFQDAVANIDLSEITAGANVGNSVVIGGPGFSRFLVVTVEWTGVQYSQAIDDNNQTVFKKIDEGVFYRVFGGAESSTTPTLPTADLALALTNTGSIPVAVVRLDFGDAEIQEANIFPFEEFVAHIEDTITAIKSLTASLLSHTPAAFVRRVPLTPLTDENALRRVAASPVAAVNGGIVRLDNTTDRYVFGLDGRVRWFSPSITPYETADLDINSTYFLRARIGEYDKFELYTTKGSLPVADGDAYDPYPADLRGTPDAASGGGFPSTSRDVLLGIIQTGNAGTAPAWTPLHSGDFSIDFSVSYADNPFALSLTILTPFACEYDISLEFDESNRNPPGPTPSHVLFLPVSSRVPFYSYTQIGIEAVGKWLQAAGSNLQIPGSTPEGRPGVRVKVRPKYRSLS